MLLTKQGKGFDPLTCLPFLPSLAYFTRCVSPLINIRWNLLSHPIPHLATLCHFIPLVCHQGNCVCSALMTPAFLCRFVSLSGRVFVSHSLYLSLCVSLFSLSIKQTSALVYSSFFSFVFGVVFTIRKVGIQTRQRVGLLVVLSLLRLELLGQSHGRDSSARRCLVLAS